MPSKQATRKFAFSLSKPLKGLLGYMAQVNAMRGGKPKHQQIVFALGLREVLITDGADPGDLPAIEFDLGDESRPKPSFCPNRDPGLAKIAPEISDDLNAAAEHYRISKGVKKQVLGRLAIAAAAVRLGYNSELASLDEQDLN